jgi:hypothetical protein
MVHQKVEGGHRADRVVLLETEEDVVVAGNPGHGAPVSISSDNNKHNRQQRASIIGW